MPVGRAAAGHKTPQLLLSGQIQIFARNIDKIVQNVQEQVVFLQKREQVLPGFPEIKNTCTTSQ